MATAFLTARDQREIELGKETARYRAVRRIGIAALGAFFGGFGGWASLVPLDAAVIAEGVVIVSGHSEQIATVAGGSVAEILVREGDDVSAGDILLRLDGAERVGEVASMRARISELQLLREEIENNESLKNAVAQPFRPATSDTSDEKQASRQLELTARYSALVNDLAMLDKRILQIQAQINGLLGQRSAVQVQLELAGSEFETQRKLSDKGLTTQSKLRQAEGMSAQLQERISGIDAQVASLQERITETGLQKARLKDESSMRNRAEIAQADQAVRELEPRLAAAELALENLTIRATTSGHVMALSVRNAGDVLQPGGHVLDIVPSNRELVVEAKVQPRDADDLVAGLQGEIRFTGLSSRSALMRTGRILSISPDSYVDERTSEAWFVIQIEVSDLASQPSEQALGVVRPGLPAEVMIPLRKRTLLQYLVEPLNQSLRRAMREQ